METQTGIALPADLDAWEEEQAAALETSEGYEVPLVSVEDEKQAAKLTKRVRYFREMAAKIAGPFDEEITLLQAEIARMRAERDVAVQQWTQREGWYSRSLEAFMRLLHATDAKLKSWATPFGKLALRAQPPEWIYQDEQTTIGMLTELRPDLLRIKAEINKAELKKVARVQGGTAWITTADGELVDLPVSVIERPPAFSIKTE